MLYQVTVRAVNSFGDGAPSTAEAVTDIETEGETESDRLIAHTARLNNQILALAAQTVTAETMTKVAGRVNTAATPTAVYEFGGQSSLQGLFGAHGKAMLEGTMEYERLLNGASFVLPVRAADGDSDDRVGAIMVWGGSESRNLDVDEDGLDWDGDMVSAHIGMDQLIRKEVLTGVLLSWNLGRFDYRDQDATSGADQDASSGDYQYRTNHIHPYIGWLPYDGLSLWATAGYGYGEIKIDSAVDGGRYTDAIQRSLAGGMNGRVLRSDGPLLGGVTTLNLKGDVARARVTVEENVDEGFMRQEVYSHRLRLLLSGEQRRESAQGRVLTPSIEVGIRYDGGDSVIGSGVEWGAGLRYANRDGSFTVEGNARTLRSLAYNEKGAELVIRLSSASGRGLSLSLHPSWGETSSAAERLWHNNIGKMAGSEAVARRSMDSEVGYGVPTSMLGKMGVLAPYTGINVADETRRLRLGGRFAGGDGASLNLEAIQGNSVDGVSREIRLRGEMEF